MNKSNIMSGRETSSEESISAEAKKYRHTKMVVEHANPLFDIWLLEWQQEAEKRNSKMKYNFQRARKSLSLYPLPLYTGHDCKLLANFGSKICNMLDQRLAQHEEKFGTTDWAEIHKVKETPRSKKRKKARATTVQVSTFIPVSSNARNNKCFTQQMSEKVLNEDTPKKKRRETKRQYIPSVRSGAYALLMALHQAALQPDYQGFMKKEQLVVDAQPLCDASLSKPDKVGCYYSAWSSMSTLIKKGLVVRQSHPPRFSITEEGKAVALQLDDEMKNSIDCAESLPSASTPTRSSRKHLTGHLFSTHTLSSSSTDNDSEDDGVVGIREVSCTPVINPSLFHVDCPAKERREEEETIKRKSVGRADCLKSQTNKNHQDFRVSRASESLMSADSSATHITSCKRKATQSQIRLQTENILTEPTVHASCDVTTATCNMPLQLLPGSFEIILCIDIAEKNGKADTQPSKKDIILSELKRNGVKYDIRKLHVGDYLWICREVISNSPTSYISKKKVKELVLPVVMERKRMDDLVRSIKDGRFREQKFRLQQCGLSHPVYLVEETHGCVASGLGMPETTYLQAIVNTQVINGFTVKVVKSQRESAAYLTIMTRYLQNKYQNMTLQSVHLEDLKGNQTFPSIKLETLLLPFSEFNEVSMKNQQLTVQEMFGKHLLQLHGVSVEKAGALVEKYGTPSLLIAAFEETADTDEKRKLLTDLKWGKAGRTLGPVISANITSLYTTHALQ